MKPANMNINDDLLRKLVQAEEKEIPAAAEKKLGSWYEQAKNMRRAKERNRLLMSFTIATAALLLVFSLNLFVSYKNRAMDPLPDKVAFSEIKMEMELKGKNIKIIWFQKKGFNLNNG